MSLPKIDWDEETATTAAAKLDLMTIADVLDGMAPDMADFGIDIGVTMQVNLLVLRLPVSLSRLACDGSCSIQHWPPVFL